MQNPSPLTVKLTWNHASVRARHVVIVFRRR
jgi:hypothetical protein